MKKLLLGLICLIVIGGLPLHAIWGSSAQDIIVTGEQGPILYYDSAAQPPVVNTNSASSITGSGAILNGNLNDKGSSGNVSVSFEYGLTDSYGSSVAGVPPTLAGPGVFNASITGLTLNTLYHFRAKAVGDETVYGNDVTFTTAGRDKIAFTTLAQTIVAGAPSNEITVQIQDGTGNPINVTGDTDINLISSSTSGKFDNSRSGPFNGEINKVTIPIGNNSASFYYKNITAGISTITVSSTNMADGTQQETVIAGTATQIRVETAANGSGTIVGSQNIVSGNTLMAYGITRDQYNNFVGNPEGTSWSLISKTNGIGDTDLVPAGDGRSAVFTGHQSGTAGIDASITGLTSVPSGIITVTPVVSGGGDGPGGSGGIGGGGTTYNNVTMNGFSASGTFKVKSDGLIQNAVQLKTTDGKVTFDIPIGTKLMRNKFDPIYILVSDIPTSVPLSPANDKVILAYNFGPDGVTFNPALIMTITYDPSKLYENIAEKDLYIAYWDGAQWQLIESTIDTVAKKISAPISHFSTYALIGKVVPPQSPTTGVTATPNTFQTATAIPPQNQQSNSTSVLAQTTTPTPSLTSGIPDRESPKLPSSLPVIIVIIGTLVSLIIVFIGIKERRSSSK
jgi:hypothetical protein